MLKPIEFLKEVEEQYEVESIKANGLQIWQILRWHFVDQYEAKNNNVGSDKSSMTLQGRLNKYKKMFQKTSNSLWNIKMHNKSYPYILFTDRLEERTINGKISDKLAHGLIETLGEKLLISVNPIDSSHRSINEYQHSNYISSNIFEVLRLKEKVSFQIENENILRDIENEYGIKVNYKFIVKDFFRFSEVFMRYLEKTKPSIVFVICYYNVMHQALIWSCHRNNIKVVELQHGLINDNHYAYNIFKPIGKDTFADYIFVFGDYVKDNISQNLISKDNIYSIGNFYIEHILKESLKNKKLQEYFENLRGKFKKIAVVTSQITVREELIEFLKSAAKINKDILYIFIPRYYNIDFSKYGFPENIIINKDIDFYQNCVYSDVHLTVYSTCALEAIFYGVPNILINMHDLGKDNFGALLGDEEYTFYVNTPKELVQTIQNIKVNKDNVKKSAEKFYRANNAQNIAKAMSKLGL